MILLWTLVLAGLIGKSQNDDRLHKVLFLSLLYRWGNWSPEKLNNLPRAKPDSKPTQWLQVHKLNHYLIQTFGNINNKPSKKIDTLIKQVQGLGGALWLGPGVFM
jgi:hypothetical protein